MNSGRNKGICFVAEPKVQRISLLIGIEGKAPPRQVGKDTPRAWSQDPQHSLTCQRAVQHRVSNGPQTVFSLVAFLLLPGHGADFEVGVPPTLGFCEPFAPHPVAPSYQLATCRSRLVRRGGPASYPADDYEHHFERRCNFNSEKSNCQYWQNNLHFCINNGLIRIDENEFKTMIALLCVHTVTPRTSTFFHRSGFTTPRLQVLCKV